jgi:hypothetical protein
MNEKLGSLGKDSLGFRSGSAGGQRRVDKRRSPSQLGLDTDKETMSEANAGFGYNQRSLHPYPYYHNYNYNYSYGYPMPPPDLLTNQIWVT